MYGTSSGSLVCVQMIAYENTSHLELLVVCINIVRGITMYDGTIVKIIIYSCKSGMRTNGGIVLMHRHDGNFFWKISDKTFVV